MPEDLFRTTSSGTTIFEDSPENKVLGVYQFFELVYSASFLLHTAR